MGRVMERRPSYVFLCFLASFAICNAQTYKNGQYPSETRLFGISYNPFALNSSTICLPVSQIEKDMELLHQVADHVRIYSLAVCPEAIDTIFCRAEELGMHVMAGLYLSGDMEGNNDEINAVKPIVERYGDIIDAIVVANEALFSGSLSLGDLLFYMNTVRDIVLETNYTIPIGTGEVWPVYESSVGMALVDSTDFVCLNQQPFWEGWDIICPENVTYECASAGEYVHLKAEGLEGYFGKPVWICESGWPTKGERCCEGRAHARDGLRAGPSSANATIFLNELVLSGRAANRPTYVHTMFDDDWKRIWSPCLTCEGLSTGVHDPMCNSCELDYHFGIYTSDRKPKEGIELPPAP